MITRGVTFPRQNENARTLIARADTMNLNLAFINFDGERRNHSYILICVFYEDNAGVGQVYCS